jgi:hypothetical protein
MVSLAKASVLPNDSLPVGIKSTCSWWLGLEVEPGPIPTYTVQLWKHTFESTMTTQIKIPSSQSQPHVACRHSQSMHRKPEFCPDEPLV